jgi:hypothetical protein
MIRNDIKYADFKFNITKKLILLFINARLGMGNR